MVCTAVVGIHKPTYHGPGRTVARPRGTLSIVTDETEETHLKVYDGDREIRFTGTTLGHASSYPGRDPNKVRWIELSVYKTKGGNYVVAGVGRTNVPGERERRWAHVCEEPEGAIEALHLYDRDGVKYLTRTAREALAQACAQDAALRDAFMVTHIE